MNACHVDHQRVMYGADCPGGCGFRMPEAPERPASVFASGHVHVWRVSPPGTIGAPAVATCAGCGLYRLGIDVGRAIEDEPRLHAAINVAILAEVDRLTSCGHCGSPTIEAPETVRQRTESDRWCPIDGWPEPGYDQPPAEITGILSTAARCPLSPSTPHVTGQGCHACGRTP